MGKKASIWKRAPDPQDYVAAQAYLSLLFDEAATKKLVQHLRRAPTTQREAKDLLRASGLELLAKNSSHVAADLKKIAKRKTLSPVLLVRGDGDKGLPLIIADGYHRICASWYWDENSLVSCCIAD